MIDFKEELRILKEEWEKKYPSGWDDYMWMTGRKDFVEGQINLLERILK